MHGSSGSRGLFVHLLAGAALGAVVVLMIWIFSGGRPFGDVVGTGDVSPATPAATKPTDVQQRTAAPATGARLASEPPDLGAGKAKRAGSGDALPFRKPKAKRAAKAAQAKRKARSRARTRKRQAVRVVAPPTEDATEEVPVAAVPSPAPTAAPPTTAAPAPQGGPAKPAKPRTPTYVAGAGEG